MKNWILSFTLATGALFANTTAFVEYELPESTQNWPILHQEENSVNTLIGSITIDGTEFFGAVFNSENEDLPDFSLLQKSLEIPFPDQRVKASLLESTPNSVLFEWSVNDEASEILHGWGRIFSSDEGIVTLNYTTGQIKDLEKQRNLWVPVLKNAHILDAVVEEESLPLSDSTNSE